MSHNNRKKVPANAPLQEIPQSLINRLPGIGASASDNGAVEHLPDPILLQKGLDFDIDRGHAPFERDHALDPFLLRQRRQVRCVVHVGR